MSRLRVLVLMGGPSTEHDVSVVSGTGVVRAMDPEKYNIHPVLIDKDGTWHWSSRELSPYQKMNFSVNYFHSLEGSAANCKKSPALSELPDSDIAFLALHGKWGEDGHIQALLENWGIPYTGCGLLASALAMDKIKSKEIYRANGIPTPPYRVIWKHDFTGDVLVNVADELGFPLVIKDPLGGSSIGIGIAKDMDEAGKIVQDLFKDTNRLLCEKFIAGGEASCGYIEGEKPLPPTEMRMTTREYFDYEAKYNSRGIRTGTYRSHPGTREERPLRLRWCRLQPHRRPHHEGRRTVRHRNEHAARHDAHVAVAATGCLHRHHLQPAHRPDYRQEHCDQKIGARN